MTYDSIMENFFDAVDEVFSLKNIGCGIIASSLIVSPAQANCDHIKFQDKGNVFGVQAVKEDYDIDSVKRTICIEFKSLIPTMTVDPPELCVAIDDDEKQPLALKFPNGAAMDISNEFSSESLRPVFDSRVKICRGLKGVMA